MIFSLLFKDTQSTLISRVEGFLFRRGARQFGAAAYFISVREDAKQRATKYQQKKFARFTQARSSVEERYIDIVEVVSSILSAPTSLRTPCYGGASQQKNKFQKNPRTMVSWLRRASRHSFAAADSCSGLLSTIFPS